MFGGHITPGDPEDEKPSSVEWISADLPDDYDPIPDKTKMWWWDEHILPVLNNAKYARNKAAVAVDWDGGPRSGEFRSMKVGDVGDHKYGKKLQLTDGRDNGQLLSSHLFRISNAGWKSTQRQTIQKPRSGAI